MLRALCIPLFLLLAGCGSEDPFDAPELPNDVGVAGDGALAEVLEPIRAAWDVPALGALMIVQGQVLETAAVGRRSLSSAERVSTQDLWHVGDLTKSMTATLAGVLVEAGHLDWTTTVAQAMPDVAAVIRVEYEDVRLEELLSHTSGLANDLTGTTWWSQLPHSDPLPDQRVALSTELMQNRAGAPRGEYLYSNGGYIVAGAMIERVMGEQWEDLIVTHVFNPLGMFTASFGAPGRAGSYLQPWGHALENGNYSPVEPGPAADSPEVVGPAGTVHMSMADLARYAAAHIAGARGADGLVTAETFAKLHQQAPGTASGLGWLLAVRTWANGIALHHEGSNQFWYANMWLAANRDVGVLAISNAGEVRAYDATVATVDALVERFEAAQAP
ncbi:MAG: serine hydrolase domain-containing protein [Gemmatimonadota bacterium]|jgi:CubicO group peptidase (beta-lactamase class C family)